MFYDENCAELGILEICFLELKNQFLSYGKKPRYCIIYLCHYISISSIVNIHEGSQWNEYEKSS